jgi:hypothetical protein
MAVDATNTVKARAVNSQSVFEIEPRDTNDHDLPDTDGDDDTAGDPIDAQTRDRVGVKVVNTTGKQATVQLEAATFDDPGFDEPVQLSSDKTAAAGGQAQITQDPSPYAFYRVVVSFSTAPADGGVKAVFTSDIDG